MLDQQEQANKFAQVMRCQLCIGCNKKLLRDDGFNLPQPGYIGSKYLKSRILLIGQNPGVSPDYRQGPDKEYSSLLVALRDNPTTDNYSELNAFLSHDIQTWPVHGSYFPLSESGLTLDDIAYFNLVRCRTEENSAPGKLLVQNCVQNHACSWINELDPRVIVCIGKWAYGNLPQDVHDKYHERVTYMNRMRSLSTEERAQNRSEVTNLVRSHLNP